MVRMYWLIWIYSFRPCYKTYIWRKDILIKELYYFILNYCFRSVFCQIFLIQWICSERDLPYMSHELLPERRRVELRFVFLDAPITLASLLAVLWLSDPLCCKVPSCTPSKNSTQPFPTVYPAPLLLVVSPRHQHRHHNHNLECRLLLPIPWTPKLHNQDVSSVPFSIIFIIFAKDCQWTGVQSIDAEILFIIPILQQ
jgi:hypothetical protein